jgi:tetratricopeptide (TPR) repeat protein
MLSLLTAVLLLAPANANARAQEALKEGQQLMASEKFAEAAQAFRRAIELDPLLTLAHHGLGQAHMALKEYPAAVAAFRGARDAFQKAAAAGTELRLDSDRAREDRIRYLRDKIDEANTRGNTGAQAQRTREILVQQWEMEISTLQRDVRDGHSIPETPAFISLALGSAHFRNRELADAEREYRATLAARPGLGEAMNNLAVVLLLTGRPAEAQAQLRQAEKAGFQVAPGLKKDIDAAVAKLGTSSR